MPASTALVAGPAPGNGMCCILMPVRSLISSPASCGVVPAPGLVQLNLSGLAFAFSMNSFMLLISDFSGTTNTFGEAPSTISGTKSLTGS